jgi:hypothetical protein
MSEDVLPYEILVHIFSFINNAQTLIKCSKVCKLWNLASKNDNLWRDYVVNKGIGTFYG